VTNSSGAVVEDAIFGYSGGGDSPSYSKPYAGGTVTTYLGGLIDVGGTAKYLLSNGHGDIVGTTDSSGAYTAVTPTDEFGVGPTTSDRLGWLGSQARRTDSTTIGLMRMGVRLYDPALGRFLEVDPVEGGSCNDYDYVCGDPVNATDLSGERPGDDTFVFNSNDAKLVSNSGWYDYGFPIGFDTNYGSGMRVTQNRFLEWEIHATKYHELLNGQYESSTVVIRYQERQTRTHYEAGVGPDGGPFRSWDRNKQRGRQQWRMISESNVRNVRNPFMSGTRVSLGHRVMSW
jgi:RHS repeat-associated protein